MKKILKILTNRMVVIGVVLLFQLGWLVSTVYKFSNNYLLIDAVLSVLSVMIVLYVIGRRDNPAYKMVWLVLILAVPVFGVLMYLLFGPKSLQKSVAMKEEAEHRKLLPHMVQKEEVLNELLEEPDSVYNQCRYILNSTGFPVYQNTETRFLEIGETYFEALLAELKKAKHFIFMEYFIVEEGTMWNAIYDVLKQKVKEGVEVRFLYDDMGCIMTLPQGYEKQMQKEGIKTRVFNPFVPFWSVVMNNRDHRKITVIDGHTGFTGGINLADEYINGYVKYGHWKDCGIMVKGEAVWNLTSMFLELWNTIKPEDTDYDAYKSDVYVNETEPVTSDGYVQPYADSPLDSECVGESVYMNIISRARRYVYIYTPYLIVDNEMMTTLSLAAKSGVDVRIVTPHVPDKKLVFWLSQSYYSQLIDAGVRIFEYTPGFLHGKCFLCDDRIGTVGSINLDYRSLYLHFECGTFLYRTASLVQMREDFDKTFEQSVEVTKEFCDSWSTPKKLMQTILRLFAPLM